MGAVIKSTVAPQSEKNKSDLFLTKMQKALFFKMDTQANITFFSEFAQQFFGFRQDEIIGKNIIGAIVPEIESTGRNLRELFREVLRHPELHLETENENIKKTGERVWIVWHNRVTYDSKGKFAGILCIAQDVTDRKRVREEFKRAQELCFPLNRINEVIHSTLDLDAIMQRVIVESAKALDAEASSIGLFENEHFVVKHVYNMPRELVGRSLLSGEVKGVHYAASMKDVVVFEDALNDGRLNPELIRTYGIRSLIIAPLIARGTVLGAMNFYRFSSSNGYSGAYIDFIRKLSASLSLALEDARLFAEVRARQERASFIAAALENSSQPFVSSYPNGRLMIFNQAFAELTGYTEEELRSMTLAMDLTPAEWREPEARVLEELRRTGEPQLYEKEYIRKDGSRVLLEVKVHLMRDGKGNPEYCYAFMTDISERRRMQEEMKHLAHHDALTGLPNRMFFTDLLARVLAQSQRHQRKLALLFLDLDRFKNVNDMLGHDVGDQLLKEVAERLRKSIRSSDTVSRIGGDEFNILLSEIASAEDAAVIARKILAAFQKPCTIAGHELRVTASIGISIYPDDSEDAGKLLKYADTAMYHAKEHGRNIYQFYNAAINISSSKRMQMENSLRQALERGELVVHYQPRVDIKTKGIVGAEALVRWNHPEMGLLEAAQFIPLAEETGFVASIDEWVLRKVCEQVKLWRNAGWTVSVTVNLSARQLQSPQLAAKVSRILKETAVSPEYLHLEITESAAMHNIERTAERLKELSEMGVQIYIDNFGTGYSSLNYLKRLPVECLKIDKSFIRDIECNSDDRTIISAITAMAHEMRLKVIAEGVETPEQYSFLRFAGCDEMQGFLFSRPLPAEEFKKLIANGKLP